MIVDYIKAIAIIMFICLLFEIAIYIDKRGKK